ncbi:MAG: PEP-CTERM sorting domain-containing protein [Rubrivivax sp.]|nr:MAG: PEP-CTERM sorting domain-containing protein [Rubrivivax sp.]
MLHLGFGTLAAAAAAGMPLPRESFQGERMKLSKLGRVAALLSASLLASANAHAARAEATIRNVQIQVVDLTPNDGRDASVTLLNGYGGETSVRSGLISWLNVGSEPYLLSTNEGPASAASNVADKDYNGTFMQYVGQFLTKVQNHGGDVLTNGWSATASSETSSPTFMTGGQALMYGDFQLSGHTKLVITASLDVRDLSANTGSGQGADVWGEVGISTGDLQTRIVTTQDAMLLHAFAGQTTVPATLQLSASFSNTTSEDAYGIFLAHIHASATAGPTLAVPEPASTMMMVAGVCALGMVSWRRRARQRV